MSAWTSWCCNQERRCLQAVLHGSGRDQGGPGLKEQVDELRKLNYQIQAEGDDINLYDAIDDIDSKMDELVQDSGGKPFPGSGAYAVQTASEY